MLLALKNQLYRKKGSYVQINTEDKIFNPENFSKISDPERLSSNILVPTLIINVKYEFLFYMKAIAESKASPIK